jgi:hypothetical protein
MIFIANRKSPKTMQPSKEAFDFPATPIAPKFPSILSFWFLPVLFMRRYQFNTPLIFQSLIKRIAIVCFITYQKIRRFFQKSVVDGLINKFYFMRRGALDMSGDRKTRSVCNCHDLGAFPALRIADSTTPFFAGLKLPSMNVSRISMSPRSYRSSASSLTMAWKTPCRTHCWNRRWHVWYGGYRWGRSFQGAPVLRIHNIAFNTSRGFLGRRPLGSFLGVKDEITGSIRFHCSFVSSILILLHIQSLMSSFF